MASRSENSEKPGASRTGAKSARPAGRAAVKPAAASKGTATTTRPAAKSSAAARTTTRPARSDSKTAAKADAKPVAKAVKSDERVSEPVGTGTGVNREMKRMMKRREGAADRLKRPTVPSSKRTKPLAFLKEVRGEMSRVAWPTREEVITYSVVVVVTVAFFMIIIYGIDYVALKAVLLLLKAGSS